jgi:hypothetical protein
MAPAFREPPTSGRQSPSMMGETQSLHQEAPSLMVAHLEDRAQSHSWVPSL